MAKPREQLVLRAMVYPGDLLMLTGALRDLHLAHPGRYMTDVETTCAQIWDHNPWVEPVDRIETHRYLNVGYPPYSHHEVAPEHLATRYHRKLSEMLGVPIPVTKSSPEVYLCAEDTDPYFPRSLGLKKPYWIVMAGGKFDTTTKWWNPESYQKVVDSLDGRIDFVQCGSSEDWHPPLDGAVNMVGKTGIREFIRLMYHAEGVLCPVTFAMHLSAAVPTPNGKPRRAVVLVGGRETPSLIQYPGHTLMHVVGQLPCCQKIGCWRYVCQETHVRQVSTSRCELPVEVNAGLKIPRCLEMITPESVVRAILDSYPGRLPVASVRAWNDPKPSLASLPARRFAYTHPRHLQEHYERAGGKNAYGRAVRGPDDLAQLMRSKSPVDLLLVGNLLDSSDTLGEFCDEQGIDRVYGEFGWFPHYSTEHADPAGYAWNSSLCSMRFDRLTRRQRSHAMEHRQRLMAQPEEALPEGVRKPFVLWPLQLLTDRVNRFDLNATDWYGMLLWTRQMLPSKYQLVIKHHPVSAEQPRLEGAGYFPNTITLPKSASLRALLSHCAGVIGNNSTVLLEARLLWEKPTWAFGRSWYSGHPELVFAARDGERLPYPELLGKTMNDPWLQDYALWFLWQLLARQYPINEAKKQPGAFVRWLHRRTAHSYAALGEDAFYV
jgi:ADP-heptose:LPS heptosyltransferase